MAPPNTLQNGGEDSSLVIGHDRKMSLIDQMSQLPRFTGSDPYYSLEKFKKEYEDWAKWLNWDEEDGFFILKKRLGGRAAEIFEIHEETIHNSKELFNILRERLQTEVSSADRLQNLWAFFQTPDMPIADFVNLAKKKAVAAAKAHKSAGEKVDDLAEEWLLNMLFKNVLPQYRRDMHRKNPKSSQEFLEIALLEEKAYKQTTNINVSEQVVCATMAPHREDKVIKMLEEMDKKMQNLAIKVETLEKEKKGNYKEPNNNITCFRCNRQGHIARECRVSDRNIHQNQFRGRGNNNNNFRGAQQQNRYGRGNGNHRGGSNNNYRGNFQGRGRNFQNNDANLN